MNEYTQKIKTILSQNRKLKIENMKKNNKIPDLTKKHICNFKFLFHVTRPNTIFKDEKFN